jgi:hypothetical protein
MIGDDGNKNIGTKNRSLTCTSLAAARAFRSPARSRPPMGPRGGADGPALSWPEATEGTRLKGPRCAIAKQRRGWHRSASQT